MRLIVLILFFSIFCGAGQVLAVSLKDCKDLALENSPLLQSYTNQIRSSIYAYRKDRSSLYPQWTAFYQPDYIQFGPRSDLTPKHGYETRVGSALSLDLQKLLTDYPALSRLDIQKNKLLEVVARNEILKTVTQDYDRLYVLLKKHKHYLDVKKFFESHLQQIKKLQARGLDVALDLNRAQVQYQSLRMSLQDIDNEMKDMLLELNAITASSYTRDDFLGMRPPDMRLPTTDIKDYTDLAQSRLNKIDVQNAREKFEQSRFYYLPTIQLGFEHNTHMVDPNVEEYRAFLSLNFNIFDFGLKANEAKQLRYAYLSQKDTYDDNQLKLKLGVEQTLNDVRNLFKTYQTNARNLKNAAKSIAIAKTYYRQGKIKETDLLSTLSDYLTIQDQTYQSLYSFLSKKADLEAMTSGGQV